jgi:hypothetical protein
VDVTLFGQSRCSVGKDAELIVDKLLEGVQYSLPEGQGLVGAGFSGNNDIDLGVRVVPAAKMGEERCGAIGLVLLEEASWHGVTPEGEKLEWLLVLRSRFLKTACDKAPLLVGLLEDNDDCVDADFVA